LEVIPVSAMTDKDFAEVKKRIRFYVEAAEQKAVEDNWRRNIE